MFTLKKKSDDGEEELTNYDYLVKYFNMDLHYSMGLCINVGTLGYNSLIIRKD